MNMQSSKPIISPRKEEPETSFEDDIPTDDAGSGGGAPQLQERSLPTEAEIRTQDEEGGRPGP